MRERKNLMSVGQVAEIFGGTAATVRRWCREGKLKEYLRTVGNHRRFREEDYRHLLPAEERGRKTVGYARVSSHDQKNDLQTQAERLRDYGCDEVIIEGEENFVGDSEIIALGGASNETKDRPLG